MNKKRTIEMQMSEEEKTMQGIGPAQDSVYCHQVRCVENDQAALPSGAQTVAIDYRESGQQLPRPADLMTASQGVSTTSMTQFDAVENTHTSELGPAALHTRVSSPNV